MESPFCLKMSASSAASSSGRLLDLPLLQRHLAGRAGRAGWPPRCTRRPPSRRRRPAARRSRSPPRRAARRRRRPRRGRARGWRPGRRSCRRWRRGSSRPGRRAVPALAHGDERRGRRVGWPSPMPASTSPVGPLLLGEGGGVAALGGRTCRRRRSRRRGRAAAPPACRGGGPARPGRGLREEARSGGSGVPSFSSLRSQMSAWRRSPSASSRKLSARPGSRSHAGEPLVEGGAVALVDEVLQPQVHAWVHDG